MGTPEWMCKYPIKDIDLETSLEGIPEGPPCPNCGDPTRKEFIEYACGGDTGVIIRAKKAAGYVCPNDGIKFYSNEAVLEALTKAREIFLERGDIETAEAFKNSIKETNGKIEVELLARPG